MLPHMRVLNGDDNGSETMISERNLLSADPSDKILLMDSHLAPGGCSLQHTSMNPPHVQRCRRINTVTVCP